MKNKVFLILLILSIVLIPSSLFSQEEDDNKDNEDIEEIKEDEEGTKDEETKKVKRDEKRFQFGIGVHANSLNFTGMSEARNIMHSIMNDGDYSYPGISDDKEDSIHDLDSWMQEDILAGYIIRNQEYGINFRVLWNALIFETDFTILPMDYTNSERSNIMIAPMIGIRLPRFVMPYLMVGANLNFSFATNDDGNVFDKANYIANSVIVQPGLILKTGVDFKADFFSIGLYYQYRMKDFNEINYWYSEFINDCVTGGEAVWNVIGSQSRIGLIFSVYFSKNEKKENNKTE